MTLNKYDLDSIELSASADSPRQHVCSDLYLIGQVGEYYIYHRTNDHHISVDDLNGWRGNVYLDLDNCEAVDYSGFDFLPHLIASWLSDNGYDCSSLL